MGVCLLLTPLRIPSWSSWLQLQGGGGGGRRAYLRGPCRCRGCWRCPAGSPWTWSARPTASCGAAGRARSPSGLRLLLGVLRERRDSAFFMAGLSFWGSAGKIIRKIRKPNMKTYCWVKSVLSLSMTRHLRGFFCGRLVI